MTDAPHNKGDEGTANRTQIQVAYILGGATVLAAAITAVVTLIVHFW